MDDSPVTPDPASGNAGNSNGKPGNTPASDAAAPGTATSDSAVKWEALALEAADNHPLLMAAWLLADAVGGWTVAIQDKIQQHLREPKPAR